MKDSKLVKSSKEFRYKLIQAGPNFHIKIKHSSQAILQRPWNEGLIWKMQRRW